MGEPELSQRLTLIYHNPLAAEQVKDCNNFLCSHIQTVQQKQRLSD